MLDLGLSTAGGGDGEARGLQESLGSAGPGFSVCGTTKTPSSVSEGVPGLAWPEAGGRSPQLAGSHRAQGTLTFKGCRKKVGVGGPRITREKKDQVAAGVGVGQEPLRRTSPGWACNSRVGGPGSDS